MTALELHQINKSFGETRALIDVSFTVQEAETIAILGPSGCGKSTLLSIIAGLETPDRGWVSWKGESLDGVPTHRRNFGLMFQDFALFPHLNVYDNVAFGLRMAGWPRKEIETRVDEVLALIRLENFGTRDVNTLSGGERQRVALARSLAPRPRLLMLDEPLGSLDRNLREQLVMELRDILNQTRQTAIYVTHDQEEAFSIATRVVLMNAGRIEQIDPPQKIYRHPKSAFVARFLGLNNLFPGKIGRGTNGKKFVETPLGRWELEDLELLPEASNYNSEVLVLLRPDEIRLGESGDCWMKGRLAETTFRGGTVRATVVIHGFSLFFDFPAGAELPQTGAEITLCFDATEAVQLFPQNVSV